MAGRATQLFVVAAVACAWMVAPASAQTPAPPAGPLCESESLLLAAGPCDTGSAAETKWSPMDALTARPASSANAALEPTGASEWGVVSSPAPHTNVWAHLYGTACDSPDDCWAVGWSNSGIAWTALAEHWDGRTWKPVGTPAPPAGEFVNYGLNTVTCISARDCWAAGIYLAPTDSEKLLFRPLMEHWDGRAWSLVDAPSREGASVDQPMGITCTSASDCWTVGYSFLMNSCPQTGCGTYSLAQHWDGHSWRRVATPDPFPGNPASAPFNAPNSVSCASPSDCWLAGYGHDGTRYGTILAHWDGHSWTEAAPPAGDSTGSHALLGVSCTSSRACWAAGMSLPVPGRPDVRQPLFERWNGSDWTVSNPASAEAGGLFAVSCGAPSDCVAVGQAVDPAAQANRTLVERWDGDSWRTDSSPTPTAAEETRLDAVSCPSAGRCVAAGASPNALGPLQPLVLARDGGTWHTALSELKGDASALFEGVACNGASDCWAVGYDEARFRSVIERWDGASWRAVPAPDDASASVEELYGVTCVGSRDCWAVGWAGAGALIVHWDGAQWEHVAPPDVPGTVQYLEGVACSSARDCWAVGSMIVGEVPQALIEHWDGSSWQVAASPAAPDSAFAAVTCNGAADCWAAGTEIAHWDGSAWTSVASPSADLYAVTCRSPKDCWAVGNDAAALHWDGSAWTTASVAPSGAGTDALRGVECSGDGRCWAVGVTTDGKKRRALLESLDGGRWTLASAPSSASSATGDGLTGIACVRAGPDCRAVGYWTDSLQVHTLAEHYPPPPVTPEPPPGERRGAAKRLRLIVSPRRAHAGRRTRFTFRVKTARGKPVRRALVRLAGRKARTGRRGKATITRTFARRGAHTARATKGGYRTASVKVRVR